MHKRYNIILPKIIFKALLWMILETTIMCLININSIIILLEIMSLWKSPKKTSSKR